MIIHTANTDFIDHNKKHMKQIFGVMFYLKLVLFGIIISV